MADARPRLRLEGDRPLVEHSADLALVASALQGDVAAVTRLGERLTCIGPIVRARARLLAPMLPATDLPDLEQEVATKVIERLASYRGLAALESWVYAFCEGEVRNAARRHRRIEVRLRSLESTDVGSPTAEPAEPADHADLGACLGRLAANERILVDGRHFLGLSFSALAGRAGAGLAAVRSRYYRALKLLRACLERAGRGTHAK